MIGIIGCGGAGGNIAETASKFGFLSGAINFSQKDLEAANVKYKLKLNGSEGVGKNRESAISFMKEQWNVAINFVRDNFSYMDVIILAFSASGGSGSGISPILLDILENEMPDKVFAAMVVIPDNSEAQVNQLNTIHTFEELSHLNVAIFPIDNQQIKNEYPLVGKNKIFQISNQRSIELLAKVVSYTEKSSKNGNFDKTDFLTVLRTQGIATISEVDISTLSKGIKLTIDDISQRVRESWSETVFTPIEFEKVTKAGVIFDGQEALMDFINYEKIFGEFKRGFPIDFFEGNYHESNGKLLTILTGLSWCKKRLNDIERSINNNKDNVNLILAGNSTYQSEANDFMTKLRKQPEKKSSVMDILNKYKRY